MNPRFLLISIACGAMLVAAAACGGDDDAAKSTATAPAASATSSVAATPQATVSATPASATPVASTPASTPPPATPSGTATAASVTPPAGTIFVPAPIDAAEILVLESFPVQYAVHITSGLPSGCHEYDHTDVERNDPQIMIYVMNRLPDDKDLACTAIYGQKETTVQLGSDFVSGTTYRVQVNERTVEFTAQ